jgi:hypothetical protein
MAAELRPDHLGADHATNTNAISLKNQALQVVEGTGA